MNTIRVLIAILGVDQHEVGAIAVSRALRDEGMEVIYAGRFNLPTTIVKTALEEDVDIIGLSCHSWEFLYYVDELLQLLHNEGVHIPVIAGGSIITPGDEKKLIEKGIAAVFGAGASMEDIIDAVQRIVTNSA
jgi:methylmalonyl-CoA mutase C-terminal domain/subunit